MCVSLSNLNVTYGEVLMNLMDAVSMMDIMAAVILGVGVVNYNEGDIFRYV